MSNELTQVACALAVFVPYSIASSLLKMLTGVAVNSGAIWNWVQRAGRNAMIRLEKNLPYGRVFSPQRIPLFRDYSSDIQAQV
ncbi:hypothetical protein VT99_11533 [Candidatus Electrothrix marina]|uniref:Uncharacterized protein n=1 Tax=Candidatus Electrothrix marina TaxID=1859130 RepID=A0A444J3I6_9BACT|nr:hypothetical protein VT99_11533 [Candidatus Electrothrix marina]